MSLELQNIAKAYDQKVLENVNCRMEKGVYGLLGPNGAGKSTMLRVICDIEPPTSGKVLYDGQPVSQLGEDYREILGYVPQKVGYYPEFTAREFLKYMAIVKGIEEQEGKKRIDQVLEMVNLKDTGKKKIKHFSGGMKQRLGIAQAILNRPKLLVLDEPTVGLDVEERMNFKQFVSEYASDSIVIFATHIVSDIEDIGNEILILKDGTVKAQASPEKLLQNIRGRVWSMECDAGEEMRSLKKRYRISNTKVKGKRVEVRLLSEKKPGEDAVPVEGNLQDLYLFLFENGEKRRATIHG